MTNAKISDAIPISDPTPISAPLKDDVTSTPIPILALPLDAELVHLPFCETVSKITAYPELEALHYDLIDVAGDGNCGIYAIMLGRIAQGLIIPPTDPYPLVVEIRQLLHNTVRDHVKALCEADPDGMMQFVTNPEEWDEALISLYDEALTQKEYED